MNKCEMISRVYAAWRDLMDNKSDSRTKNWPLMSSPFPTILICLIYVYIVKVKNVNFLLRHQIKWEQIQISGSRSEIYAKEKTSEITQNHSFLQLDASGFQLLFILRSWKNFLVWKVQLEVRSSWLLNEPLRHEGNSLRKLEFWIIFDYFLRWRMEVGGISSANLQNSSIRSFSCYGRDLTWCQPYMLFITGSCHSAFGNCFLKKFN